MIGQAREHVCVLRVLVDVGDTGWQQVRQLHHDLVDRGASICRHVGKHGSRQLWPQDHTRSLVLPSCSALLCLPFCAFRCVQLYAFFYFNLLYDIIYMELCIIYIILMTIHQTLNLFASGKKGSLECSVGISQGRGSKTSLQTSHY